MAHACKILRIEPLTHDVLMIVAEKPAELAFSPGQAADISINKPGWAQEVRSFTFTSLPDDMFVEFSIKTYPSHHGVTNQLLTLVPGDELLIGAVYGDISYKGEGLFIAGGAGITPFIAIFKHLEKNNAIGNNTLLFANKTAADIIQKERFERMLGNKFINILSEEIQPGYEQGFVTAEMIKKYSHDQTQYYYLCGPPPMMLAVENSLAALRVPKECIIKESF